MSAAPAKARAAIDNHETVESPKIADRMPGEPQGDGADAGPAGAR